MIRGLVDGVVELVVLLVSGWVAVFGGTGAVLARTRGGSAFGGLLLGLLGPLGWVAIWFATRPGDGGDGDDGDDVPFGFDDGWSRV